MKDSTLWHIFKDASGSVVYNSSGLMSADKNLCGHFCLFFILEHIWNQDLSFYELLNEIFTNDLEENERRVLVFLKDNYPDIF